MVVEGEPAPDFELRTDAGDALRLSSLRGRTVIVYFYPRDHTAGCTTQACGIRDAWSEFEGAGVIVLGVSPDPVESHAGFKDAYDLPFTLLADPDHEVAEAYGVWQQKSRYGRTYMGIVRSTFVIDEGGTIAKALRRVKPETHADEVLGVLAPLSR